MQDDSEKTGSRSWKEQHADRSRSKGQQWADSVLDQQAKPAKTSPQALQQSGSVRSKA